MPNKAAVVSKIEDGLDVAKWPRPLSPHAQQLIAAVADALIDPEATGGLESGEVVGGTLILTMTDGREVAVPLPSVAVPEPFYHSQGAPATTWTIVHNLGLLGPPVVVLDSSHREVECDVAYTDANTVTLSFAAPFSGSAYVYP